VRARGALRFVKQPLCHYALHITALSGDTGARHGTCLTAGRISFAPSQAPLHPPRPLRTVIFHFHENSVDRQAQLYMCLQAQCVGSRSTDDSMGSQICILILMHSTRNLYVGFYAFLQISACSNLSFPWTGAKSYCRVPKWQAKEEQDSPHQLPRALLTSIKQR